MNLRPKTHVLPSSPFVKGLVRWTTGKSLTNRLPKQSLMTLLRLCGCATPGIPSTVCLLSRFSLLLNCLGCVEIEDSSFIPFRTMEDANRARCLTLNPWLPV